MHLYLAVNNTKVHIQTVVKQNPENILFSYHYFKDVLIFEEMTEGWYPKRLMIDSGAFSVWTKQGHINIDNYITFCKNVKEAVDQNNLKLGHEHTKVYFVNLDVLPGNFGVYPSKDQREASAQKGFLNMEYMENAGVKVIHVFHQHEDFSWLKKIAEHQEYIGLSPANDEHQTSKNRWLAKCFSILKASRKCHGFAVTSRNTLVKFPFYSADSSSWVQGAKYAAIPTFKDGKLKSIKYKDANTLSELNERSDTGSIDMLNSYHSRMEQGVKAYMQLGDFVTDVWDKRGIKWD